MSAPIYYTYTHSPLPLTHNNSARTSSPHLSQLMSYLCFWLFLLLLSACHSILTAPSLYSNFSRQTFLSSVLFHLAVTTNSPPLSFPPYSPGSFSPYLTLSAPLSSFTQHRFSFFPPSSSHVCLHIQLEVMHSLLFLFSSSSHLFTYVVSSPALSLLKGTQ